ncbi:MAG: glycogen/starch synthase, partial [Endomicrobiales bacterium]
PISKTGGMANVVGELPKMLVDSGLKVYVVTPLYKYSEVHKGGRVTRRFVRDETVEKFGVEYTGEAPRIYMGRHGEVPAGLGRARIQNVEYLLLANDNYADALYGQLRGDTTDANQRVSKEHEALRAQFLSYGALEAMKAFHVYPAIVAGNDWMCAPLMALLDSDRSLYRHDPHFAETKTIGWVHNNGQDYQFKVMRTDYGVDLLDNLGIDPSDYGWFIDPHNDRFINFMGAFIRHSGLVIGVSPGQVEDYLTTDDKGGAEGFLNIFRKLHAEHRVFPLVNGVFQEEMQRRYFGRSIFDLRTGEDKKKYLADVIERKKAAKREAAGLPVFWGRESASRALNGDSFVINTITRITDQKGIKYVLPFAERVLSAPRYAEAVFMIGGSGDPALMYLLNELVRKYPGRFGYTNGNVSGKLHDTTNLCGDVFIAFSEFEPGGISPMEGKCAGNVCLLSNRQGHKSTVTRGEDGALFDIDFSDDGRTVNNILREFDRLYTAWKDRQADPKWYSMVEKALFSDHSWSKAVADSEALFKYSVLQDERYYKKLWPKAVVIRETVKGQGGHFWFDATQKPAIHIDEETLAALGFGREEAGKLNRALEDAYSLLEGYERQALLDFQRGNKIQRHTGEWMELPLPVRLEKDIEEAAVVTPYEIVLNAGLVRAPPEVLLLVLLHGIRRSLYRFEPDRQMHDAAVFQKTLQFFASHPAAAGAWKAWTEGKEKTGTFYGRDWPAPFKHARELALLDEPWWQTTAHLRADDELLPAPVVYRETYESGDGKHYAHVYYVFDLGDGITKVIRFAPAATRDWIATRDASESYFSGTLRVDIVRDAQDAAAAVAAERAFYGKYPDLLRLVDRLAHGTEAEQQRSIDAVRDLVKKEDAPGDLKAFAADLLYSLSKTHPDRNVRLELNRAVFDLRTGRPAEFPVSTFNYSAFGNEPYTLRFAARSDGLSPRAKVRWSADGAAVKEEELAPVSVKGATAFYEWRLPVTAGWVHYAVQARENGAWQYARSPYDGAGPSSDARRTEFEYYLKKDPLSRLNGVIKFQDLAEERVLSLRPEVFNLRLNEFKKPLVDRKGNLLLGTLRDLAKQLKDIKEQGFSELYLQALEVGAPGEAGPDSSPFSPLSQVRIDHRIGGMNGLLQLKKLAEDSGLRLSLDMIPHLSRSNREVSPRTAAWIYSGLEPVRRAASDGGLSGEWLDGFSRNWANPDNVREYAAQIAQLARLGFDFRIDVGHAFDTTFPPHPDAVGLAKLRGDVTVYDTETLLFEGRERTFTRTLDLRLTEEPNSALAWVIYEAKKAGREAGYRTRFSAENWHGHEARLTQAGVDFVFDSLVANLWNIVRNGRSAAEVTGTLRYLQSVRERFGGGTVTLLNNHDAQLPPADAFGWLAFAGAGALAFINGGMLFQHMHYSFRDEETGAVDFPRAAAELWQMTVNNYGPTRLVNGAFWPGFDWPGKLSATEANLLANDYLRNLHNFENEMHALVKGTAAPLPLEIGHDRVVSALRKKGGEALIGFFNFDSYPAYVNFCPDDAHQQGAGIGEPEDGAVYEFSEIYNNEKTGVSANEPGDRMLLTGRELRTLGIGPRYEIPLAGIQVFKLKKVADALPAADSPEYVPLLKDSLARMYYKGYGNADRSRNSFLSRELTKALEEKDREKFFHIADVISGSGGNEASIADEVIKDAGIYEPSVRKTLEEYYSEYRKKAAVEKTGAGAKNISFTNRVGMAVFSALGGWALSTFLFFSPLGWIIGAPLTVFYAGQALLIARAELFRGPPSRSIRERVTTLVAKLLANKLVAARVSGGQVQRDEALMVHLPAWYRVTVERHEQKHIIFEKRHRVLAALPLVSEILISLDEVVGLMDGAADSALGAEDRVQEDKSFFERMRNYTVVLLAAVVLVFSLAFITDRPLSAPYPPSTPAVSVVLTDEAVKEYVQSNYHPVIARQLMTLQTFDPLAVSYAVENRIPIVLEDLPNTVHALYVRKAFRDSVIQVNANYVNNSFSREQYITAVSSLRHEIMHHQRYEKYSGKTLLFPLGNLYSAMRLYHEESYAHLAGARVYLLMDRTIPRTMDWKQWFNGEIIPGQSALAARNAPLTGEPGPGLVEARARSNFYRSQKVVPVLGFSVMLVFVAAMGAETMLGGRKKEEERPDDGSERGQDAAGPGGPGTLAAKVWEKASVAYRGGLLVALPVLQELVFRSWLIGPSVNLENLLPLTWMGAGKAFLSITAFSLLKTGAGLFTRRTGRGFKDVFAYLLAYLAVPATLFTATFIAANTFFAGSSPLMPLALSSAVHIVYNGVSLMGWLPPVLRPGTGRAARSAKNISFTNRAGMAAFSALVGWTLSTFVFLSPLGWLVGAPLAAVYTLHALLIARAELKRGPPAASRQERISSLVRKILAGELVPARVVDGEIRIDEKLMARLPSWMQVAVIRHEQRHLVFQRKYPSLSRIPLLEEVLVSLLAYADLFPVLRERYFNAFVRRAGAPGKKLLSDPSLQLDILHALGVAQSLTRVEVKVDPNYPRNATKIDGKVVTFFLTDSPENLYPGEAAAALARNPGIARELKRVVSGAGHWIVEPAGFRTLDKSGPLADWLLDATDFQAINVILPRRLGGRGDLGVVTGLAKTLKEMYPGKTVRVLLHHNSLPDAVNSGFIRGFDLDGPEAQEIDGITYVNLNDKTRGLLRKYSQPNDINLHFAAVSEDKEVLRYPRDMYGNPDSVNLLLIDPGMDLEIMAREKFRLGYLEPWPYFGEGGQVKYPGALGLFPPSEPFIRQVRELGVDTGRKRDELLSLLQLDRSLAGRRWGVAYALQPEAYEAYLTLFRRAFLDNAGLREQGTVLFMATGGNKKNEELILERAREYGFRVTSVPKEGPPSVAVERGGLNKADIVVFDFLPHDVFEKVFILADDLPSLVRGAVTLSHQYYISSITGRPFFFNWSVWQGSLSSDLREVGAASLKDDVRKYMQHAFHISLNLIPREEVPKAASVFYNPEARAVFQRFTSLSLKEFSFKERLAAVLQNAWTKRLDESISPVLKAVSRLRRDRGMLIASETQPLEYTGRNVPSSRISAKTARGISLEIQDKLFPDGEVYVRILNSDKVKGAKVDVEASINS